MIEERQRRTADFSSEKPLDRVRPHAVPRQTQESAAKRRDPDLAAAVHGQAPAALRRPARPGARQRAAAIERLDRFACVGDPQGVVQVFDEVLDKHLAGKP